MIFQLANEMFAVDVENILTVKEFKTIMRVPDMPPYMVGLINLIRDRAAIIDIRAFFNISVCPMSYETSFIILKTECADDTGLFFGLLADSLVEVTSLDNLHPQHVQLTQGCLRLSLPATGKSGGRLVTVVDFEAIVSKVDQQRIVKISEWAGIAEECDFLWYRPEGFKSEGLRVKSENGR